MNVIYRANANYWNTLQQAIDNGVSSIIRCFSRSFYRIAANWKIAMFAISYTQLHRLSFLNVFNLVNVARRNDVIPRSYAKTLSIYQLSLTLCTPTLSVTLQFHVFFFSL